MEDVPVKKQDPDPQWYDKDERSFIDRLGTKHRFRFSDKTRAECLKEYLECLKLRVDYGKMNRRNIVAYAEKAFIDSGGIIKKDKKGVKTFIVPEKRRIF